MAVSPTAMRREIEAIPSVVARFLDEGRAEVGAAAAAIRAAAPTFVAIVAFRGLIDVLAYRMIPRPSLYGADEELKAEDVVFRRRRWYWRTRFRRLAWLAVLFLGWPHTILRGL